VYHVIAQFRPYLQGKGYRKPHALLVKAGIHSSTANRILYDNVRSFRLDHIEKLCKILICEPQDLLLWIPEKGEPLAETHPLHNLKQQEPVVNWKETLNTMPYKQLKQVTKAIVENANTGM
jgi:DNA-binding Xre family transcriptional regulator